MYDHIDPEFKDAEDHIVSDIGLLCPTCHNEKTTGRLSQYEVKEKRLHPFCKTQTSKYKPLLLNNRIIAIEAGGNIFYGESVALNIGANKLLGICAPTKTHPYWQMSGEIVSSQYNAGLKFNDNNIEIMNGNWDVQLTGKSLKINLSKRNTLLHLLFSPNECILTIKRLYIEYPSGFRIDVNPKGFDLYNLRHTEYGNTVDRLSFREARIFGVPPGNNIKSSRVSFKGTDGSVARNLTMSGPGNLVLKGTFFNNFGIADLNAITDLDCLVSPDQMEW